MEQHPRTRFLSAPADKQKQTEQGGNHDSSLKNEPTGMVASSAMQHFSVRYCGVRGQTSPLCLPRPVGTPCAPRWRRSEPSSRHRGCPCR